MPVHRVTLDMHKAASVIRPEVYVRVGDHNQTLEATLYDNGEVYRIPEGGYAKLQIKGSRGVIVRSKPMETVQSDEGLTIVRCIIPPPSYTDVGIAERAYVAVYASEGTEPESSSDIKLIVQPGTTDELYVRYYDEEIEQAKASLTDEEESRQDAERKRQEAEEERKAAEKTRRDDETIRKEQEEKRQRDTAAAIKNAEQATSTANAAANTATTAAADAKSATDASKAQTAKAKEATDAANTATDAANTAASGADAAAERANDAASGADAAAERAGTSAGKADAAASNAEDKATLADTAAQRADTAAQAAEDGEAERDRKDQERDDKISEWEAAEEERKSAELKRAEAATAQAKQQADNNAAQAANDEAQARNNADQQQNNVAAQGRLTRILKPGEYDPESREPAIEGDLTHVFAVPTKEFEEAGAALETAQREFDAAKHAMSDVGGERPQFEGQLVGAQAILDEAREVYEAVNRYVEWLWLLDAEGSGFWELYGSGNATLPDPISTEEYDRMWAGENVETKHVAYSSGVSYDTTKAKSAIADAVKAQAEVQSTTDTAQNAAIEAAQKAGDDAASALGTFKTDQGRKDEKQDTAIEKAQKRADEAYNHLPDVVSSEANGILPAFPSEGGPFLPVVKDGELIGWQELPTFDTTQPGFVPVAPEGEVKVLLSTGWGDYSAGGMPDSRPLKASIAKATASKEAARVQGSGDYDFGTNVTTQAAMDAIGSAIEAAQAVLDAYDDPSTTQAMLDAATKELDAALSTFESTFTPLAPDKSGLTELESRYTELKTGVSTSTNGKDVAFGTMWATSAEQQAADTALQTARTNVEAATKQSQIKSACDTLKTALDTYQSARKTATADYAALDKAIQDATAAKKDVLTSDSGGSDLPAGSNYVTSAQMETFNAALSTAQSTRSTASTQAALDSATSTLTTATTTFKGQIQQNLKIPQSSAELEAMSWEEIAQLSAAAAKDPTDFLFMTDASHTLEKTITMSGISGVTTVKARIIGIGQDKDPSGNKLGITFQLRDGLEYNQPVNMTMNSSAVTTGGWRDSLMRLTNLPKIEAALPAGLKAVMKTMVKKTNIATSGSTMTETQDKLALLSCVEVFGSDQNNYGSNKSGYQSWYPLEGEWYQWYQNHNTDSDRIIKRASGSALVWWLRSIQSSQYFARVYGSGIFYWNGANDTYLSCACFSV